MSRRIPEPTKRPIERAFIVGVELSKDKSLLTIEDSIEELKLLADTAGLKVVGTTLQRRRAPDPKTFIGKGKLNEVETLAKETLADLILFDGELSPRHQRELEEIIGPNIRVLDRTALILDIFAQHASTREGSLQVELAQYEYRLPRLTRAWTHLARQAGGGGGRAGSSGGVGLRGPGETQLEVDRREIRRKIDYLKREINKLRAHRQRHRTQRKKSRLPLIALVGYTNAGKSTLLNRLSDADVYVANQLFATLDPTTRRISLPNERVALLTDTVGFIQKLPTMLIAAFRATLEEISSADLLIHIVDANQANLTAHTQAVLDTLLNIDASHIPIITVINKIDLLPDPETAKYMASTFPNAVAISALNGDGVESLLKSINDHLFESYTPIDIFLPYDQGKLLSMIHDQGIVEFLEHKTGGVHIKGKIPGVLVASIEYYMRDTNGNA